MVSFNINKIYLLLITLHLCLLITVTSYPITENCQSVQEFVRMYNTHMLPLGQNSFLAIYNARTNITRVNTLQLINTNTRMIKEKSRFGKLAKNINASFCIDVNIKRQFDIIVRRAKITIPEIDSQIQQLLGIFRHIFYSALGQVTHNPSIIKSVRTADVHKELSMQQYLETIMKTSTDANELVHAWSTYRIAIGPYAKRIFPELVHLRNFVAKQNGYVDNGDYLRIDYDESDDLNTQLESVWLEMKRFYQEIHAYVRYKLSSLYPLVMVDGEAIPAHFLGEMWAIKWKNIYKYVVPYPGKKCSVCLSVCMYVRDEWLSN